MTELRRLANQIKGLTAKVSGAVDVSIDNPADVPFLDIKFDRKAIARYGLTIDTVSTAIETAFAGQAVSRIMEDVGSFDLVVRYGAGTPEDLDIIRSTLIMTASGAQLPLHALADIRKTRNPNTINRENTQRKIVVMANVAERDLAGVVKDIRTSIEQMSASLAAIMLSMEDSLKALSKPLKHYPLSVLLLLQVSFCCCLLPFIRWAMRYW